MPKKSKTASPANAAAFERLRARVPLHTKIFVAKVYDLAEQVDAVLAERHLTRRDLARLLGKTDSEVSKWFGGLHNLTLESIAKLEAALGVDLFVTPRKPGGYFTPSTPTAPAQHLTVRPHPAQFATRRQPLTSPELVQFALKLEQNGGRVSIRKGKRTAPGLPEYSNIG